MKIQISNTGNRRLLFGAVLLLAMSVIAFGIAICSIAPRRFDTIEIRGSQRFQGQVVSALTLLKTKSPRAYEIVTNNIGIVAQSKHSGMAAWKHPPVFQLNDVTAFYSVTWCAISISHDSLHSKMYHDYLKQHSVRWAPDNVWTGEQAEKRCCEYQYTVAIEIGAPTAEIAHSQWDPNDRYWEVPYDKVNW